jgi:hypothetical protein
LLPCESIRNIRETVFGPFSTGKDAKYGVANLNSRMAWAFLGPHGNQRRRAARFEASPHFMPPAFIAVIPLAAK